MSELRVFADTDPTAPEETLHDHAAIAARLADTGVRFERWSANKPLPAGASADQVIAAYQDDIDRLIREDGYQTVDVVSMVPDHPDRELMRQKFLDEHRHSEDEVRFFVDGKGLFSLHIGDRVFELLCVKGDLVSVPANTPHWFDMGPAPAFTAIRLFNNPEGWIAHYTGDNIANHFSRLEA